MYDDFSLVSQFYTQLTPETNFITEIRNSIEGFVFNIAEKMYEINYNCSC